jgi:nickel-dependent lactate racemase
MSNNRFHTSDAFATWLAESHAVQEAYERWQQAETSDTAIAYAAYLAALDREEMASQHFQSLAA